MRNPWTRRRFLDAVASAGLAGFALPTRESTGSGAYAAAVLAKRPAAYWRLGESHGPSAFDETRRQRNGAYHGRPSYLEAGAIRGDPNKAIKLDGHGSYVEIPDDGDFSQPSSGEGLSVEVWLRPDLLVFAGETADPHVHWLGKGDAGRHEWAFRFYSKTSSRPNRLSAYVWNPDGGLGAGAYFQDALEPGEWMHIVACFEPGDRGNARAGVSIYKNGVLRGGPTTQPGALYRAYDIRPAHGSAPLRFGTRDLKSFLTGGLDEIAVYPRVLTADEIRDNYRKSM